VFALLVRFDLIDADSALEFDSLVSKLCALIRRNEPRTLTYETFGVSGADLSRVFFEVYEDQAAFDEHERKDYVRSFLSDRERYVANTRVERLSPLKHVYAAQTAR
jgi:quinol monooxygenase YgiN